MRLPLAKDGWRFIIPLGIIAVALWLTDISVSLSIIVTALTIFVIAFFRDPERNTPEGEGLVISPADGKIIRLEKVKNSILSGEEHFMVSIFMSVFNVHVNRIPLSGKVTGKKYNYGKFISAFKEKSSNENENNVIVVRGKKHAAEVVQIAGLIARRIVCWVNVGDDVSVGNRFGLIRFGSRVDVYLPVSFEPGIVKGQKVKAGETILGVLK
ncbi:MAG: phosphatidylserine decarboxylase family protein [Candidatus Schekmanbacteria bacterium]|nr:phosphatidylserine decarboxylase family protein [Candidatus Schekmanbacteria bacterium]